MTVNGAGAGSGSCTASHTYAAAGVYTIDVTVRDDDTGSATSRYEFVVVFDPSAGFVTGGGWIVSPAGRLRRRPDAHRQGELRIRVQVQEGCDGARGGDGVPVQCASFNFHSTLSVARRLGSGAKAQFKGYGTVNGSGTTASCSRPTTARRTGSGSRSRNGGQRSSTTTRWARPKTWTQADPQAIAAAAS